MKNYLTYAHMMVLHFIFSLLLILLWPNDFIGEGKTVGFWIAYFIGSIVGWIIQSTILDGKISNKIFKSE